MFLYKVWEPFLCVCVYSHDEVHEHIEKYFAQAQQVVATPIDLAELCLLITHCFEDHCEAEAVQEDAKLLHHASTLIVDSLDGIQSQGKTWQ